jgi:MbnP
MRIGSYQYNNPAVLMTAFCCFMFSCQKDISPANETASANLQIRFKPVVDGAELIPGKTYANAYSENYSVSTFKFYIHAVELINSQTNTVYSLGKENHYLINAINPSSSFVDISIPAAAYNRIGFIVGVDSVRNVSGAQNGALDPAQGMFWTWSTGYIMAKLEGNSPLATTPNNVIEYHIGGFKGTESVLRKVVLDFPAAQGIELKKGGHSTINISANINNWFIPNPIRISQKPVSMTPGPLSTQIADNYSHMFTVVDVINE